MDDQEEARSLFSEGLAHYRGGDFPAAERCLRQSLERAPDRVSTLANLAAVLVRLGRLAEARRAAGRALAIDPSCAPAELNLGLIEREVGRPDLALRHFESAARQRPQYAEAWINRAGALNDLGRYDEALDCCASALRIDEGQANAWFNRGVALAGAGLDEQAVVACVRAQSLDPRHGAACQNRGAALERLHRLEEALQAYEEAERIDPDLDFLAGSLLHARMQLCDWREFEDRTNALFDAVRAGTPAVPPFVLLALADDPALLHRAASTWCKAKCPVAPSAPAPGPGPERKRIRLGYFSADFHDHATAHLMAGLFEAHDAGRFERIAFSFGPVREDAMRKRLVAAFDDFIEVRTLGDAAVARMARERGIDIAIDLKGYTEDARPGVFAWRAAPVQASYLGYPGTMAAGFIDYIIADAQVIAPGEASHYAEKVVTLPGSYQVNDRFPPPSAKTVRGDHDLPPDAFVFCCFNKPYKITPDCFALWMRLLARVDGSVLWLLPDHPTAANNLRQHAGRLGVDPERLVFAPRLPVDAHLARHALADLFLDTLPYNAHTTASDALRMGLPVLTCRGRYFPGRVAASLLHALEMDELIVDSAAQFEALAIELARDPVRLGRLRAQIQVRSRTAALFDPVRFARHLERAFAMMHERRLAGLPPDHIVITGDAGA